MTLEGQTALSQSESAMGTVRRSREREHGSGWRSWPLGGCVPVAGNSGRSGARWKQSWSGELNTNESAQRMSGGMARADGRMGGGVMLR